MTAARWLRVALALLLLPFAIPGQAHKASDAYLTLRVDGSSIEQRLDIALRDIDRELTLDADGDDQLTWGEVRSRWPQIERLASEGVRVQADGRDCALQTTAPAQLDEHTDGRYAVLRKTWQCADPIREIDVDYRLFVASDATHRGIALIVAGAQQSAVLVPGAGPQRFMTGTTVVPGVHSFAGFVVEGVHHIAVGADHILFLVTLLMVAVWRREGRSWVPRESVGSAWEETLRLVTAFTVAHSITLALAASGVLAPPTRWVESLIATSVLLAAVDNLWPFFAWPRWTMVSVFGLVHGFGFAGPLQDLGLSQGNLGRPLLGFNLGVELGQLALVALLLPLAVAARNARLYRLAVVRGGSAVVALVALAWTVERSLNFSILP